MITITKKGDSAQAIRFDELKSDDLYFVKCDSPHKVLLRMPVAEFHDLNVVELITGFRQKIGRDRNVFPVDINTEWSIRQ